MRAATHQVKSKNRVTVCKGVCGIGNRLLFVTRAIERCASTDSKLFVLWNDYMYSDTPETNVFYKAFEVRPSLDAGYRQLADVPHWRRLRVEPSMWSGMLDRDIYSLPPQFRDFEKASVITDHPRVSSEGILEVCLGSPPAYQRTRSLVRLSRILTENIAPSDAINKEVDKFFNEHFSRSPSLGVHVRGSAADKRKVDLRGLWKQVNAFLARNSSGKVFLATDSRDIQELFRHEYGDVAISRPKWIPESSADTSGAEENSLHKRTPFAPRSGEPSAFKIFWDAVVELFLLSRCDSLLYQHNSSFSVVASVYASGCSARSWGAKELSVKELAYTRLINNFTRVADGEETAGDVLPRLADNVVLARSKNGHCTARTVLTHQSFDLDQLESRLLLLCNGMLTVKEIAEKLFNSNRVSPRQKIMRAKELIQRVSRSGLIDPEPIRTVDGIFTNRFAPLKLTGIQEAPAEAILRDIIKCVKSFQPRGLGYSEHWSGINVIVDSKWTDDESSCPSLVQWIKRSVPWMPNRAYLARLEPRSEIGWHSDYPEREGFSKGILVGISCPRGSFIEFLDSGKFTYENGRSYYAKLGIAHRVVNPTDLPRFTAFIGSPANYRRPRQS